MVPSSEVTSDPRHMDHQILAQRVLNLPLLTCGMRLLFVVGAVPFSGIPDPCALDAESIFLTASTSLSVDNQKQFQMLQNVSQEAKSPATENHW